MGLTPQLEEDAEACYKRASREVCDMLTNIQGKSLVWVVTRREDRELKRPSDGRPYTGEDGQPLRVGVYHIQGIFSDETKAVAACRDETYLVGPLPLNLSLPHDPVIWFGAYFPLGTAEPGDDSTRPFWHALLQTRTV